jgi:hypothetical protein
LGVKNYKPANTLFGAAGYSLGEIRSARLGVIEFDRKFRIELRGEKRGSGYDQVPWLGYEPIRVLLPILPGVPFGQLNFVCRRVVGIDGKIALVHFAGFERAARREKYGKNKRKKEAIHQRREVIGPCVVRCIVHPGCNDRLYLIRIIKNYHVVCREMMGSDARPRRHPESWRTDPMLARRMQNRL